MINVLEVLGFVFETIAGAEGGSVFEKINTKTVFFVLRKYLPITAIEITPPPVGEGVLLFKFCLIHVDDINTFYQITL